jgi:hypothetical protein
MTIDMNTSVPFSLPEDITTRLTPVVWRLWWEWQERQSAPSNPWARALTVEALAKAGMTNDDVSWLIERNILEKRHLPREGRPNRHGRSRHQNPALVKLTKTGATFLEHYCLHRFKPHWNAQQRVLSVEGHAIKVYRQPSENQELILTAFQEDDWVRQIDDPLPRAKGSGDEQAKVRLRKTVEHLNRAQHLPAIFFSVASNSQSVRWSFRNAAGGAVGPSRRQRLSPPTIDSLADRSGGRAGEYGP